MFRLLSGLHIRCIRRMNAINYNAKQSLSMCQGLSPTTLSCLTTPHRFMARSEDFAATQAVLRGDTNAFNVAWESLPKEEKQEPFNMLLLLKAKVDSGTDLDYEVIKATCANHNIEMTVPFFAQLFRSAAEAGDLAAIKKYMNEMQELSLMPNQLILSHILHGYVKAGSAEDIERTKSIMAENSCWPSALSYKLILQAYADLGDVSTFRNCLQEAETFIRRPVTMNDNLEFYVRFAIGKNAPNAEICKELLSKIKERSPELNFVGTARQFRRALCRLLSKNAVEPALDLYRSVLPEQRSLVSTAPFHVALVRNYQDLFDSPDRLRPFWQAVNLSTETIIGIFERVNFDTAMALLKIIDQDNFDLRQQILSVILRTKGNYLQGQKNQLLRLLKEHNFGRFSDHMMLAQRLLHSKVPVDELVPALTTNPRLGAKVALNYLSIFPAVTDLETMRKTFDAFHSAKLLPVNNYSSNRILKSAFSPACEFTEEAVELLLTGMEAKHRPVFVSKYLENLPAMTWMNEEQRGRIEATVKKVSQHMNQRTEPIANPIQEAIRTGDMDSAIAQITEVPRWAHNKRGNYVFDAIQTLNQKPAVTEAEVDELVQLFWACLHHSAMYDTEASALNLTRFCIEHNQFSKLVDFLSRLKFKRPTLFRQLACRKAVLQYLFEHELSGGTILYDKLYDMEGSPLYKKVRILSLVSQYVKEFPHGWFPEKPENVSTPAYPMEGMQRVRELRNAGLTLSRVNLRATFQLIEWARELGIQLPANFVNIMNTVPAFNTNSEQRLTRSLLEPVVNQEILSPSVLQATERCFTASDNESERVAAEIGRAIAQDSVAMLDTTAVSDGPFQRWNLLRNLVNAEGSVLLPRECALVLMVSAMLQNAPSVQTAIKLLQSWMDALGPYRATECNALLLAALDSGQEEIANFARDHLNRVGIAGRISMFETLNYCRLRLPEGRLSSIDQVAAKYWSKEQFDAQMSLIAATSKNDRDVSLASIMEELKSMPDFVESLSALARNNNFTWFKRSLTEVDPGSVETFVNGFLDRHRKEHHLDTFASFMMNLNTKLSSANAAYIAACSHQNRDTCDQYVREVASGRLAYEVLGAIDSPERMVTALSRAPKDSLKAVCEAAVYKMASRGQVAALDATLKHVASMRMPQLLLALAEPMTPFVRQSRVLAFQALARLYSGDQLSDFDQLCLRLNQLNRFTIPRAEEPSSSSMEKRLRILASKPVPALAAELSDSNLPPNEVRCLVDNIISFGRGKLAATLGVLATNGNHEATENVMQFCNPEDFRQLLAPFSDIAHLVEDVVIRSDVSKLDVYVDRILRHSPRSLKMCLRGHVAGFMTQNWPDSKLPSLVKVANVLIPEPTRGFVNMTFATLVHRGLCKTESNVDEAIKSFLTNFEDATPPLVYLCGNEDHPVRGEALSNTLHFIQSRGDRATKAFVDLYLTNSSLLVVKHNGDLEIIEDAMKRLDEAGLDFAKLCQTSTLNLMWRAMLTKEAQASEKLRSSLIDVLRERGLVSSKTATANDRA